MTKEAWWAVPSSDTIRNTPRWVGPSKTLIVKPGNERRFLRDLPISLLPISEEMGRRLSLLGIKTMGEFASLPAQAVVAQFGREGRLAHRLACGKDERKVIPWQKALSLEASQEFDSPLENTDILLEKAKELAGSLIEQLLACFRMCQRVIVTLRFDNGQSRERSFAFHEPTSSKRKIESNIAQLLESFEYRCGVSGLSISLRGIRPENGRQLHLLIYTGGMNGHLDQVLKGLVFKYGSDRFRQALLADRQDPLPENRFVLVEYEPQG
jgi:protein ImuB